MTDFLTGVVYDERANRWRYLDTGRFVSESTVQAEVQRHVEAAQESLQTLTRQLYGGSISLADWQSAAALELKDAHLAQAMFGAGGRVNMGAAEWGRVGRTLRDEYGYLNGFAEQIAAGQITEAQALARIQQYGNNSGQSYWNEWQRGRDNPDWAGLPRLTRLPRDGSTICHGNCRCELVEHEGGIDWIAVDDEGTCLDCADMAANSPWRPM